MTMPLCLLHLDFLLCKQQKTTNNLPCVHLVYGESLKMMQYMVCGIVGTSVLSSGSRLTKGYWPTRKVLEANCIYPLLLF